jgi:hypothetical protein
VANTGSLYLLNNESVEYYKKYLRKNVIKKYGNPPLFSPDLHPTFTRPNHPLRSGEGRVKPDALIEEEKNIYNSLLRENLIPHLYPTLYKLGLKETHIKKIESAWKTSGIDINDLPESLERAEHDINNNPKIEKPLAYVKAALMQGPYEKPKGFVSKAEKAAKQKAKEQKESMKLQKQANETAEKSEREKFESWWDSLSEPEQNKIDNQLNVDMSKTGAKLSLRFARMDYYKKNVKGEIND